MCAIFGITGTNTAANSAFFGLHAMQHRGQESAGIASHDGELIHKVAGMGYVDDVFPDEKVLGTLTGKTAIGHTRYSTTGTSRLKNAQPFEIKCKHGRFAIAHNGNLTNTDALRADLEGEGAIFQTESDTEVILHLYARANATNSQEAIIRALTQVEGSYALVMLTPDGLVAARDPRGFKPLVIGRLDDSWIVASETCALDILEAKYVRDVERGEIVFFTANGMPKSIRPFGKLPPQAACIFEHVYFARPDSYIFGNASVSVHRQRFGYLLAKQSPADADIVAAVPDSGVHAALGFAEGSGLPYKVALTRNHYVGRTFINPSGDGRRIGVRMKLNPIRSVVEGKRIVLVDDSIVRGITSRKIVRLVKTAGAKEVHVRISCPPTIAPCHYGIDTPDFNELIASSNSVEEICRFIEADSLAYLKLDATLAAVDGTEGGFCTACYTGDYPVLPHGAIPLRPA
ncbi:MAG: amidophosphoribosyltransferase [Candidatus Doudnabacteria bacterium RIFCSPLOWO2_02_FULL_48_8]|uniref:Amidophosphoribosyltransferase n=1 Tax=Candidatus Doudnabacteria bacterium RIFCSPHIGHO2_01_FULL_46_24 TaxID=1817825 RepID=A0A1F5NU20_9BACT|nr:MAG: amidophosphoribosyltransferase [Candidatus Doudnabacteria bacterium RIFCSPHIGHO2_01_FULL_46_24]OGE95191.1 MAG: amidophosphoribosyltransferase [Candidatus Doudnabacteria bacterium RIFCSPLOWO2_02_FULL_48_8]OGE96087.1 MAG: amidophosphoribosyltransferase [Candidatus Doudnabacteria bacterium RIFCSPHIGHO2_12_FULL_48_11]